MSKDYYKTLGVDKSASQDEIKKAFRKLAHEHHPDKGNGNADKFKEINEAYQTLGKPEKRKQYDQFGSAFNQQGGFGNAGAGGFNWQDFMNQARAQGANFSAQGGPASGWDDFDLGDIFGDFFGGGRTRSRARSTRGSDLEYQMEITLEDSAFGADKTIQISKLDTCDKCNGQGYEPSAKLETCPQCKGSGRVVTQQRTILGVIQSQAVCPTCEGAGKKPDRFCSKCHGAGRIQNNKQLKIKIPAGINHGESIKLSGEGEAGEKGAQTGDLYIAFTIKPQREFTRQGYDILSKVDIDISQAALGDKIDINTLDGKVKLKIPTGTDSGQIFKLSGKGTQKLHGRGRGDHLVEVIVKTPQNLTRQAKKLLNELKEEL